MKTTVIQITLAFLSLATFAQEAEFNWAIQLGSNSDDGIEGIVTDEDGSIYSTGWFRNTFDVDPSGGSFGWTSLGAEDMFISKFDSVGQLVWANRIGGPNDEKALDIAIDFESNVFITGYFYEPSGSIDFDPSSSVVSFSSQFENAFVAKYDSDGNLLWAAQFDSETASSDFGTSVASDLLGNVLVVGTFEDSVDFDPGPNSYKLHSDDGNVFIVKLNSQGQFVWAKQVVGGSDGYSPQGEKLKVETDQFGNVYVAGDFVKTADFDPSEGEYWMTSPGSTPIRDMFLLKLSSAGNFQWAGQISGSGHDQLGGLSVDESGNCYLTGWFTGSADFNPDQSGLDILLGNGTRDVFVCKWDQNRQHQWAVVLGKLSSGNYSNYGYGITHDSYGNVYSTGSFAGIADFDPDPDNQFWLDSYFRDSYVSKLNSDGEFVWAKLITSDDGCFGSSVEIDIFENVIVAGGFEGSTDFNPDPSNQFSLTSFGYVDAYVTRWTYLENISTALVDAGSRFNPIAFPNPSNGIFQIHLGDFKEFHVYDGLGKLVSQNSNPSTKVIDLSGEPAGIYTLKVLSERGWSAQKLVKQ